MDLDRPRYCAGTSGGTSGSDLVEHGVAASATQIDFNERSGRGAWRRALAHVVANASEGLRERMRGLRGHGLRRGESAVIRHRGTLFHEVGVQSSVRESKLRRGRGWLMQQVRSVLLSLPYVAYYCMHHYFAAWDVEVELSTRTRTRVQLVQTLNFRAVSIWWSWALLPGSYLIVSWGSHLKSIASSHELQRGAGRYLHELETERNTGDQDHYTHRLRLASHAAHLPTLGEVLLLSLASYHLQVFEIREQWHGLKASGDMALYYALCSVYPLVFILLCLCTADLRRLCVMYQRRNLVHHAAAAIHTSVVIVVALGVVGLLYSLAILSAPMELNSHSNHRQQPQNLTAGHQNSSCDCAVQSRQSLTCAVLLDSFLARVPFAVACCYFWGYGIGQMRAWHNFACVWADFRGRPCLTLGSTCFVINTLLSAALARVGDAQLCAAAAPPMFFCTWGMFLVIILSLFAPVWKAIATGHLQQSKMSLVEEPWCFASAPETTDCGLQCMDYLQSVCRAYPDCFSQGFDWSSSGNSWASDVELWEQYKPLKTRWCAAFQLGLPEEAARVLAAMADIVAQTKWFSSYAGKVQGTLQTLCQESTHGTCIAVCVEGGPLSRVESLLMKGIVANVHVRGMRTRVKIKRLKFLELQLEVERYFESQLD